MATMVEALNTARETRKMGYCTRTVIEFLKSSTMYGFDASEEMIIAHYKDGSIVATVSDIYPVQRLNIE